MERRYSVKEIDALREACERRWLYGTTALTEEGPYFSRQFSEDEKAKCVEETVRTYMLAGITAEDIYEADRLGPCSQVTPVELKPIYEGAVATVAYKSFDLPELMIATAEYFKQHKVIDPALHLYRYNGGEYCLVIHGDAVKDTEATTAREAT